MKLNRFTIGITTIAVTVALGVAAASAGSGGADPGPDQMVDAELEAFWAEVEATGLIPIGQNADGTGPHGWVRYDDFVVVDGEPHADLEVYDVAGAHIGWVVYGLAPLTIAEYEADPEGLRLAGLERIAEFEAAAAAAG